MSEPLTPEQWKKIKSIYQQAVEIAPENRALYLKGACGGDLDLRREIESMLEFEEAAEEFIEQPMFELATHLIAQDTASPVGQVGNYRIVREIGRGGMGAVYEAVRDDGLFDQRVAIKVIKRGMDTEAILRRFSMERQILASLDHPNIARLLDGGTTETGAPYFVMEYVEGLPVNEYCESVGLDLNERLKLFRKVCSAISYAHRNLVVHRDIKPSNILVNQKGEPKLLDFGIARLLQAESSGETETMSRLMTPEYASPEQIRGEKIATTSDVYSLGVLLYELLTGVRPFSFANRSLLEINKIITDSEPSRPSLIVSRTGQNSKKRQTAENGRPTNSKFKIQNSKLLKGDLDTILLTALRKEPERRYSSVEQFSEDIRRYLENLPVLARRDKFSYRAKKFIKRNRTAVSVSVLVALVLIGTTVFAVSQARIANLERARAERRFKDVRKLANAVLFDYHDKIETLPNSTEVREKMLKDSLVYLDSLSNEATDDRELLRELGMAYEKVGTIQGNSWFGNLNDTPEMKQSYQKSFEIRQRLVALDPGNAELQRELAIALENLGDVEHQTGNLKKALEDYEEARKIIARLAAEDPKHLTYLARLHSQLAHVQGFPGESNLGETAASVENYRRAVEIMEGLYQNDADNPKTLWGLSVYRRNLGNMLLHTGDAKSALKEAEMALELAQKWVKIEPDNINARESLGIAYGKLADIYAEMNEFDRAVEFQQKSIKIDEPGYLADPKNRRAREVSIWYYKLGDLYVKKRDFTNAEKWHLKALEIFRLNYEEDPASMDNMVSLADSWFSIAAMYNAAGKLDKAGEYYAKSLQNYEAAAAKDAANLRARVNIGEALSGLGEVRFKSGEYRAALDYYEKALSILRERAAADAANAKLRRLIADVNQKAEIARGKV